MTLSSKQRAELRAQAHHLQVMVHIGHQGVTETVRRGLEMLKRAHAYRELRKLRGKVKFQYTIDQLRDDD